MPVLKFTKQIQHKTSLSDLVQFSMPKNTYRCTISQIKAKTNFIIKLNPFGNESVKPKMTN